MKTYFHIGQHKTGTTSIQHYLRKYRTELISQGWFVPDSIAGYRAKSHFILNVYALDAERSSTMKEKLIKEHGTNFLGQLKGKLEASVKSTYAEARSLNCHNVIWSNEGLYLLQSSREYQRLLMLFEPYSSENISVCCFREVNSYRSSYINELLKTGYKISSDPNSYRYTETDSWLFDYEGKQKLLDSCFDKCQFFDYEPINNLKAFLQCLGISPIEDTDIRLNASS